MLELHQQFADEARVGWREGELRKLERDVEKYVGNVALLEALEARRCCSFWASENSGNRDGYGTQGSARRAFAVTQGRVVEAQSGE